MSPTPMTREEAASKNPAGACGAQSKLSRRGAPSSFFICTNDADHDPSAHTACDGEGHVLARWQSQTSVIEVWGPWGYAIV